MALVNVWRDGETVQVDDATLDLPTPPDPRAALLAYAADARWRKEVGGITLSGMPVATDDRSKLMIAGARTKAKEDPTTAKDWKGASGDWVSLGATQLIAAGDAVDAHVTACFSKERAVAADIASGGITSRDQIDAAFEALSTAY